ncbi:hypothetical protein OAP56_04775 [Rickettsiaceae bacterium]|nr:hypothetical protein [Rickettsiaceae bacterium]
MSLGKVEIVEELYKQNCEKIIDLLSMQENKFKSVLIIGHNPHIYDLILEFAQHNTKEYAYLLETTMPPARIVVINFPNIHNWQDIRTTKGKIEEIFTP